MDQVQDFLYYKCPDTYDIYLNAEDIVYENIWIFSTHNSNIDVATECSF